MKTVAPLLMCLLSALVEIHSQTVPYLTFMGNRIPNHSYVDLNTVRNHNSCDCLHVRCHTDLTLCCSGAQGPDRGDWYFPNESVLPYSQYSANVYEGRGDKLVTLRYSGSGGKSGIYRCDVETSRVKNKDGRKTVYVGLYAIGGDITIPSVMTLTVISDLNGDSPQFTLTCISTGGPATTVTWTRDSETVSGGVTMLNDPVTAQYTHTLTVTGRLGGEYQCTVENSKPSTATARLIVKDQINAVVVFTSLTTASISWSIPNDTVESYEVRWKRDTSGECADVDEGNATITDGSTSYTITGLEEDSNYTITVTAGNAVSDLITANTGVAVPSAHLPVSAFNATTSSITVQWGPVLCIQRNGDITGYSVQYGVQGSGSTQSVNVSGGDSTDTTISELTPSTTYNFAVAAVNSAGTGVYSDPLSVSTLGGSFMITFNGYIICTDWMNDSTSLKLADITHAVQEKLNSSCQCQITNDTIDEEFFACFEASPNSVTYQARLSGTFERDSASLISLIEDWVSTGPTIHVRGVLMWVGEECSMAISDLSCRNDKHNKVNDGEVPAMIFGLVVVFIMLISIILILILVVVKMRPSSSSAAAQEFSMTSVGSSPNKDDAVCNSNEAYNVVEQQQAAEVENEKYEEIGHSKSHRKDGGTGSVRGKGFEAQGQRGESGGAGGFEMVPKSLQLATSDGEGVVFEQLYEELATSDGEGVVFEQLYESIPP